MLESLYVPVTNWKKRNTQAMPFGSIASPNKNFASIRDVWALISEQWESTAMCHWHFAIAIKKTSLLSQR